MRDKESVLEGRNPVLEAFKAKKPFDRIFIQKGLDDSPIRSIMDKAKRNNIQVKFLTKNKLDEISQTGAHQGVIAYLAAFGYSSIDDILERAKKRGEDPFIFILDAIEDPHNLGAIIRTADAAGVHGVIIPKNRASSLTSSAAKASAGAISHVPVAKVTNLNDAIKGLKDSGLWIVGSDMEGDDMYSLDLTGPLAMVIGNEGKGISRLTLKNCDMVARIPMRGELSSLNASVAAGVLAYEALRQRMVKNV